jgi:hypothetical protein
VKVSLHKGFGKQPDPDSLENWIGVGEFRSALNTEGKWIRFSAPFEYFSDEAPEFALVVINSGAKLNPVAGSVALFDDIELIYNTTSSEPLEVEATPFIAVTGSRILLLQHMDPSHYRQLNIYDITGKRVWSVRLDADRVDLSTAGLAKGTYVVSTVGPEHIYNQKIMLH